ncbi:hypothetical protein BJX65DRAFT_273981 [Aspergillus insuetus]
MRPATPVGTLISLAIYCDLMWENLGVVLREYYRRRERSIAGARLRGSSLSSLHVGYSDASPPTCAVLAQADFRI